MVLSIFPVPYVFWGVSKSSVVCGEVTQVDIAFGFWKGIFLFAFFSGLWLFFGLFVGRLGLLGGGSTEGHSVVSGLPVCNLFCP